MNTPVVLASLSADQQERERLLRSSSLMEILLFSLGSQEIFGVNVFKVREIGRAPPLTRAPNMPDCVEGLISLRGNVIPVLSLARAMHLEITQERAAGDVIMVVEFSRRRLAFLVKAVNRIIRVEWSKVRDPEGATGGTNHFVSAITELPDGKLASILDLEEILASVFDDSTVQRIHKVDPIESGGDINIFFVDDSQVARRNTAELLDRLGVKHKQAQNGMDAWKRLSALANHSEASGKPLRQELSLVLLDAEMPEMDGFILTRNIRADRRFDGIPIVMLSALSSEANRLAAKTAGVDAYVTKFDPEALAATLRSLLRR